MSIPNPNTGWRCAYWSGTTKLLDALAFSSLSILIGAAVQCFFHSAFILFWTGLFQERVAD